MAREDILYQTGRARPQNPLDTLSENLAEWIDVISGEMADAIIGGLSAPFSQPLSEADKLEYYTRQMFNPDGTPNYAGRTAQLQRLGPVQFAETLKEVLKAHPEWKQQAPSLEEPPPFEPSQEVTSG